MISVAIETGQPFFLIMSRIFLYCEENEDKKLTGDHC